MLDLIDEFGARLFLVIQSIKSIRENKGGMYCSQHPKAKTEIETVYNDVYYVKNTIEEILNKLYPHNDEVTDENV